MLNEVLKVYKAKSDGTTLYDHNQALLNILNQLNLDTETFIQMENIIKYHDVGKMVSSFQDNIESTYREVRHEMLSASVESLTEFERLAILTHHKTIKEIRNRFLISEEVYLRELKELEIKLGEKTIDIRPLLKQYYTKKTNPTLCDTRLIQLKGLLNYCDHLGSSNITVLDKGQDLANVLHFESYSSVQVKSKKVTSDLMIISPTGSGKTEASLYWANNIDETNTKRIFYILPYTASITAMYHRLKEKNLSVGMLHSKAAYSIYKEASFCGLSGYKAKEEYQSYKYFTKHITISTTHQLFKAVFNCRFNEMLLSIFKGATFIIDEVHCYEAKQLALILQTLKYLKDNFDIHICIMSASMPTVLCTLIQSELGINKILKLNNSELIKIKRHKIQYVDNLIYEDLDSIKTSILEGKKVLICVNKIETSLYLFNLLRSSVPPESIALINSMFNIRDRECIEKTLKDKQVLIGTQVIEVSLNIDFDVLYTEVSPIDSQIQRWGRINRKQVKDLKERKMIYIYDADSNIYDDAVIDRTKRVLKNLDIIHECDIQNYLDAVYTEEPIDYLKYACLMKDVILPDCQMGKWCSSEAEFNTFMGISVLPSVLETEYMYYLDNNAFYEANSLLVNIPNWRFKYASENGAITQQEILINGDSDNKMLVYMINYKYDSQKGLQFNELPD